MTDTKPRNIRNVDYYMGLPYNVVVRADVEEGDFVARVVELPGCSEHGNTPADAWENLQEAQRLWITTRLETGLPIPTPESEEELPSGKWVQRVPRTLHRELTDRAKKEHVSLNQLVSTILAAALPVRRLRRSGTVVRNDTPRRKARRD